MLSSWLRRTRRPQETGASAVEYGMLVALIAGVVIIATLSLSRIMTAVFVQTCEGIVTNNSSVSTGSCRP
jgi:Flp pilus assembly pilin Flp